MATKKITTLLITRHGNVHNPDNIVYARHVNVLLSTDGHFQMEKVGKDIKARGFEPVRIYASTLTRAQESSREIAKSFPGIEIESRHVRARHTK